MSSEVNGDTRRFRFGCAVLLYASLAGTLTVFHALEINLRYRWQGASVGVPGRAQFHEGIVAGDWSSPYQYRILAPAVAEVGGRIFEAVGITRINARELTYIGVRWLLVWLTLVAFHLVARTWLSEELSLAATVALAGLHLYTFRSYFYQPSSPFHLLFLTTGTLLALRGRTGLLYPLTAIAALARETSGLLVAVQIAVNFRKPGWWRHAVGLLLVWSAVQAGLRVALGPVEMVSLGPIQRNFEWQSLLWISGLFGLFWIWPVWGWRSLPPELLRMYLLLGLPLFVFNMIFGVVSETRLFLEMALVTIPGTFIVLFGTEEERTNGASTAP